MVTFCDVLTRTIAFGSSIAGGPLMTACRAGSEKSVIPSLPAGIVTCSM
jgi:hypothetical protein